MTTALDRRRDPSGGGADRWAAPDGTALGTEQVGCGRVVALASRALRSPAPATSRRGWHPSLPTQRRPSVHSERRPCLWRQAGLSPGRAPALHSCWRGSPAKCPYSPHGCESFANTLCATRAGAWAPMIASTRVLRLASGGGSAYERRRARPSSRRNALLAARSATAVSGRDLRALLQDQVLAQSGREQRERRSLVRTRSLGGGYFGVVPVGSGLVEVRELGVVSNGVERGAEDREAGFGDREGVVVFGVLCAAVEHGHE